MFAVLLQSQSPYGVRQTAIVPLINGETRVFTRVGQTRGVAGAWSEEVPDTVAMDEFAVGTPVAISISASDYRDLQFPITPTTLLQKLVRAVREQTYALQTDTLGDKYADVLNIIATTGAPGLIVHTKAMTKQTVPAQPVVVQPVAVAPTIQVVHTEPEPEPVTQYVAEVVETIENPPTQAVLDYAQSLVADKPTTSALAVLTVPDAQEYYERSFDGLTETELFDYARSRGENVLLTGDAGTGKTSSATNYAHKRNLPFVTIELTQQIDQSITQGRFVPTGIGNETRWVYSQLASAIQQPSVVLLNELTRMSPKAASLFLRLLNERELLIEPLNEVIKVHPECLIIADQNTGLGYTGTMRQDNALLDRFHIKLEFKYDNKIESKFIKSSTLLEFANSIRQASELNDQFSIPMSTRLLKNFQSQATGLNFTFAVNTLLNSFPKNDGEREAIKMRFDTEYEKIAQELGVDASKYSN